MIAELCQNHNGDVGIIKEMVAAAAEAAMKVWIRKKKINEDRGSIDHASAISSSHRARK